MSLDIYGVPFTQLVKHCDNCPECQDTRLRLKGIPLDYPNSFKRSQLKYELVTHALKASRNA